MDEGNSACQGTLNKGVDPCAKGWNLTNKKLKKKFVLKIFLSFFCGKYQKNRKMAISCKLENIEESNFQARIRSQN